MSFSLVQATIPSDTVDAIGETFWQAGARGLETLAETPMTTTLRATFPGVLHNVSDLRAALVQTLAAFDYPPEALHDFSTEQQPEEDWLAKWKADWQVQPVGQHWLIVPPWRRAEARAQTDWAKRIHLEIEPGMAFGTGTHETTRACLTLMEELPTLPAAILDVGTGTGILAIAAAKRFPQARCDACDTDPAAVAIATENARRNGTHDRTSFRVGSVTDYPQDTFDLVLANLTAETITALAPHFVRVLRPGGHLILAGVLRDRQTAVLTALSMVGLRLVADHTEGEWWAGLAQTPSL